MTEKRDAVRRLQKNRSLRSMGTPAHIDTYRALGAKVTTMGGRY